MRSVFKSLRFILFSKRTNLKMVEVKCQVVTKGYFIADCLLIEVEVFLGSEDLLFEFKELCSVFEVVGEVKMDSELIKWVAFVDESISH